MSIRELYIKKYIQQPPEIISFTTRFYGSILLLLIASQGKIHIDNVPVFIGITMITVVITAFTTIVRLRLIKAEEISLTTPWLGAIPLFMVVWSAVIFRELPNATSFLGIIFVCLGAFTINFKGGTLHMKRASLLMLLIAGFLGLTTTLDKIAIGASSAITYSLIWTVTSTFLMYGVAKKKTKKVLILDKHLIVQAVFWVAEFLFQMLAVQNVSATSSGTTYVKTLTMLNIIITTIFGSIIFKEKDNKKRIISALLIFVGAVILVLFRG